MEKTKERRLSLPLLAVILLLAVIIGTVIYSTFIGGYKTYSVYEVEAKTERGSVIDTKYFEKNGNLITYNNEGVSSTNSKLKVNWNVGMSLTAPKVAMGGDFIAAAGIGEKTLRFMNWKTTPVNVVTKELPGAILDFSVSDLGQVAVLMNEKKGNVIQILEPFQQNEDLKAEIKTYHKEDGYGMALALSPDGKKLVTEYIKRDGTDLKSILTFYHFGRIGENTNADRIVGIFPYEDSLFGKLSFLTEKDFVAVGDNKILGFHMKHEPALKFEKGIHGKIQKVEADGSGLALLIKEDGRKTKEEGYIDDEITGKNGTFLLRLDLDGDLRLNREISMERIGLGYKKGETIVYSDEGCLILNPDGSEKFKTTFQENILGIFQTGEKERYFILTGNHVMTIKLNP